MPQYYNSGETRRVFSDLQRSDGSTVELDPGQTVELPEGSERPGLKLVQPKPHPPAPKADKALGANKRTRS